MLMLLKGILVAFLIPPVGFATLAAAALLLRGRAAEIGRWAAGVFLFALILLATPFVSRTLVATLSVGLERVPSSPASPEAIVVLGGDVAHGGPPGPEIDVGPLTLERLRAGAALARQTGLPILVSGGSFFGQSAALSSLMAASLVIDFARPAPWLESRSSTTWENAIESAALLKAHGIGSIYLVTHAMHMRRALLAFRHFGVTAIPVPVRLDAFPPLLPGMFMPSATAWQQSYYAFHEWIGWLAYAIR